MNPYTEKISEIEKLIMQGMRQTWGKLPVDQCKLSRQQIFLLRVMYHRKRLTVSELSMELNLSVSATTIAVNRLVKSGLILRTRDEQDRRLVWLQITEQGVREIEIIFKRRNEILETMFSRLTEEETGQMIELLRKMLSQ